MRAYMERQLTTASVPIVRYYDHLRLVYQVETPVRELRSQSGIKAMAARNPSRSRRSRSTPGETRQNPEQSRRRRGCGNKPTEQARTIRPRSRGPSEANGSSGEHQLVLQNGSVQSGGAAMRAWERGKVWIA